MGAPVAIARRWISQTYSKIGRSPAAFFTVGPIVMAPWFFISAPLRSFKASVTLRASSSVPNSAYGATRMIPPSIAE